MEFVRRRGRYAKQLRDNRTHPAKGGIESVRQTGGYIGESARRGRSVIPAGGRILPCNWSSDWLALIIKLPEDPTGPRATILLSVLRRTIYLRDVSIPSRNLFHRAWKERTVPANDRRYIARTFRTRDRKLSPGIMGSNFLGEIVGSLQVRTDGKCRRCTRKKRAA